jgi:hypothetical protein
MREGEEIANELEYNTEYIQLDVRFEKSKKRGIRIDKSVTVIS